MPTSGVLKLSAVVATILAAAAGTYAYHEARLNAEQRETAIALVGGNPDNARAHVLRYGCGGCHTIEGIPEAVGVAGPSLNGVARENWVAGIMPSTVDNLVGWIVNPQAYDPQTAMPRSGISEAEARDVAAYLLSIR
jgi:mono/diheme cytochrome c family protein